MNHFENVWKFRTARTEVRFDVGPDDDLDLSFDDDGSVTEGLRSGLFVAFVARVRVLIDGEEAGCSYLGGCIYKSAGEFMDHKGIKATPHCGSYFTDMIREAVAEARAWSATPRLQLRLAA